LLNQIWIRRRIKSRGKKKSKNVDCGVGDVVKPAVDRQWLRWGVRKYWRRLVEQHVADKDVSDQRAIQ
jgi:hypothetical protein